MDLLYNKSTTSQSNRGWAVQSKVARYRVDLGCV